MSAPLPAWHGRTRTWPGTPSPLGATWDGEGTNFALFSPGAEAVDLCLFDDQGNEHRIPLEDQTFHVWHGYVPGAGPGTRYGFRVDGPHAPADGHRWNSSKLLTDPYARALEGELVLNDAIFSTVPGKSDEASHGHLDSAPYVPRSVVVHDAFPWGSDVPPRTPWSDTVIYEMHVRGFTMRHPAVPPALRGTYAALGHPAVVNHLTSLGVTAVELMPVHHFVSEPHLLARGMTNYWGYNSLGYFAPHAAYSSSGRRGEQVREFKAMVRTLHAAGIEVILDVVYNHTCEGGADGPTVCWRGIDNAAYYRLDPADPKRYVDYTGCGNTLNAQQPHVLQMIMDSLRYWVTEMHVDGFRFDLASALARSFHDVDKLSAFFDVIQQDPVVSQVKLIAEPWDIGEGGYQVGEFPPLWTEWNGRYRDTVRDFWRGAEIGVADLGFRLTGSSDLYQDDGRAPSASINFITAHDGFTMADLVSFDAKHNDANGESNQDGTDDNRSTNCGVEGRTEDQAVLVRRRRLRRAMLATLCLSAGVPMLTAGDEIARTQGGNNNAYCLDNETSWLDWIGATTVGGPDPAGGDPLLTELVGGLLALRRRSPVLRQQTFFRGRPTGPSGLKDLAWFGLSGEELTEQEWTSPAVRTVAMYLSGDGIRSRTRRGEAIHDDSYFLVLHSGDADVEQVLPPMPWAGAYDVVVDTAEDSLAGLGPLAARDGELAPGSSYLVRGPSVVLLRAHRL